MSICPKTIEVVKKTAPVVGANALDITSCFYKTMFANNPEALAYFNKANQNKGAQQRALADAVVAYATNIDNLGALSGAVTKIAHRHVGLSITPNLYPIVHKNMMDAIGQVLGDAVTPEIAEAWDDAVNKLAGVCIGAEENLYKEMEARPGGWRGEKSFKLVKRTQFADDTVQFTFAPIEGQGPIEFTPGQYLTIRIPALGAAPRHYTITSSPGEPVLQCTTRKVDGGEVSTYMHEKLEVDQEVLLGVPVGIYTAPEALLQADDPKAVLVGAGIGVTPMWALAKQLTSANVRSAWLVDQSETRMAFGSAFVNDLGIPTTCRYTRDESGNKTKVDLAEAARGMVEAGSTDDHYFVCGPVSFMSQMQEALNALGCENVHTEVFGTGDVKSTSEAQKCPFAH